MVIKTLYTNVDGHNNIAIGTEALYDNSGTNGTYASGGFDNVAIGYQALFSNDVGIENVAIGSKALFSTWVAGHGISFNTGYWSSGIVRKRLMGSTIQLLVSKQWVGLAHTLETRIQRLVLMHFTLTVVCETQRLVIKHF